MRISDRRRGWLGVLAIGLVMACGSICDGAEEPALREWTAAQGGYKTQAIFVRQTLGKAVLRRADGVEIEVALEQLSEADRNYIAERLRAPASIPAAESVLNAGDSHLPITFSYKEHQDQITAGTVIHEDDRFRYIVTSELPERGILRAHDLIGRIFAIVGNGGKMRRVLLQKVSLSENRLVLAASKGELPPPFRRPQGASVPKRGDRLRLVGIERQTAQSDANFRRVVTEVVVEKSAFEVDGKPVLFQVHPTQTIRIPAGVIVDSQGVAVAIAEGERVDAKNLQSVENAESSFFSYLCRSPDDLAAIMRPSLLSVSQHFEFESLKEARAQLLVQTFGLSSTPVSTKLRMLYVETDSTPPIGTGIHLRDGVWINQAEKKGVALELVSQARAEPKLPYALPSTDWPHLQQWSGSIPFVPEDSPREFEFLVVAVRPDGKYQPIRTASLYPVLGVATSDEKLKELREFAKPKLKTLPGGGQLVTSAKTAVAIPPRKQPSKAIKKPQQRDRRVLASVERHTICAVGQFDENVIDDSMSAATSADGKWLYIFDFNFVLHRIDTETWTERTSLDLPKYEEGRIYYSEHGLVVVLDERDFIWILDPESLELKFEVEAPRRTMKVTSAKSNWLYLFGEYELRIVDLSTGRTIHRFAEDYFQLAVGTQGRGVHFHAATLSDDGRRLVVDYNRAVLYRRDGDDLILEDRITDNLRPSGTPDGKYLILKHRFDSPDPVVGFRVVNDDPQRSTKVEVRVGSESNGVKYDAGGYFLAEDGTWQCLFDSTGKRIELPETVRGLEALLVVPGDSRYLASSQSNCVIVDLKPERLEKAFPNR